MIMLIKTTMKFSTNFNVIFPLIVLFSNILCNNYVRAKGSKTTKRCINCVNNLIDDYQDQISNLYVRSSDITTDNEIKNERFLNESLTNIIKSYENLNEFSSKFKSLLSPIEKKLKLSAFEFLYSIDLSNECLSAIYHLFGGLQNKELWAYQFLDSSGRMPSGLTEGVLSSFGEYDQCLGIRSDPTEKENDEIIYGKYCLVKPVLPINDFKHIMNLNHLSLLDNNLNDWLKTMIKNNINRIKLFIAVNQMTDKLYLFHYGICIPSQCQPKDVEILVKTVINPMIRIPIEVGPNCNTINDTIDWNSFNIIVVIMPAMLTILVLISTLYSLKCQNTSQRINVYFHEIMKSFSIIESNKRLFTPFKDRFLIVDLFMLCMIFWVCIALLYGWLLTTGGVGYKKIFTSFAASVLNEEKYFWLRTLFPRNSLFFLSGIIISADFFGKKIPITLLSYLKFALEKWYRFAIKVMGPTILFGLLMLMGSGPIFNILADRNTCSDTFWQNIFLFNQFVKEPLEMCNPSLWFYPVIYQLHLISPLFMAPFLKSLKFGLIFNSIAILIFGFVKVIPKLFFGFDIIPYEISKYNITQDMKQSLVRYFFFTDQYIYIFILGIVVGYFIRKRTEFIQRLTKTKWSKFILSICCYSLTVLSLIWSENFKDLNSDQNQISLISWFVFGDILWSTGIIWTIFLFHQIEKGILSRLASSTFLSALNRLSLAIVVNFCTILCFTTFIKRQTIEITHMNQLQLFYNDMSLAVIASYLMYVLLEYPFIRLLEIFKNRRNVIHYNNNIKVFNVCT